ncbi:DUF2061 domain-containing protein [uncultured Ferrimonas sp.]|uniref:DUF2061 domain-containing protein n=1 Tax=uncultured Ferrimonas sp. TaxID=432640 RepID=UPI00262AD8CC|nr:DUF2061 domain-containing protein [uncultured Ferrimonas sp.]
MLKTTTFALMHFSIAFSLAYLITGSLMIGGLLAIIEPAVNTVGYILHEKLWRRVDQRKASQRRAQQGADSPALVL